MKFYATKTSLYLLLCSSIATKVTPYQYPQFLRNIKSTFHIHLRTRTFVRKDSSRLYSTTTEHSVNGLKCVEITIPLPKIGTVTILEANAASQDTLVNSALEPDPSYKLNADDPYGAVLWPSARTLAEYLIMNYSKDNSLSGLTILELGAGTGLISIAAAMAGANVIAADYEDIPLNLLQYASIHLNPVSFIQTINFDVCNHELKLPKVDIIVAADIMYEPKTGKAMAKRAMEGLRQNSRVIIADSPGRPGRVNFLKELKEYGIKKDFMDYQGCTCTGYRNDLICGKDSTSISSGQEKGLSIAIMDLDPIILKT